MRHMHSRYEDIISVHNLCAAWREFLPGKKNKKDVAAFSLDLSHNIYLLHKELQQKTYRHGGYEAFNISDPKPRNIHKATVRDRLLHHALYRKLYPYFDRRFIYDSYSCRLNKGTHRAMERFKCFARKTSANDTKTCWILKCDIKKFFASVDHALLLEILEGHALDSDTLGLLREIINSFANDQNGQGVALTQGLPLGNLTSQLLVNVYMNEFDQWMKHVMKTKWYIRYADDFTILSDNKSELVKLLPKIGNFLEKNLALTLHPDKVFVTTFASGVDFLGWVHFPDHRVLRTTTKRRMLRQIDENKKPESVHSYLGMLWWGNAEKLRQKIQKSIQQAA